MTLVTNTTWENANRNAKISVVHSVSCTELCFAICRFSQVLFVTSNNATHNLLFCFQQFLRYLLSTLPFSIFAQYLLFFHSGCSGMCCFSSKWATARSQQVLFVVCGFGSWSLAFHCRMARQISPLRASPDPLSNRSVLHLGRKHKTVVFHNPTPSAN